MRSAATIDVALTGIYNAGSGLVQVVVDNIDIVTEWKIIHTFIGCSYNPNRNASNWPENVTNHCTNQQRKYN